MKCSRCQAELGPQDRFCAQCGQGKPTQMRSAAGADQDESPRHSGSGAGTVIVVCLLLLLCGGGGILAIVGGGMFFFYKSVRVAQEEAVIRAEEAMMHAEAARARTLEAEEAMKKATLSFPPDIGPDVVPGTEAVVPVQESK